MSESSAAAQKAPKLSKRATMVPKGPRNSLVDQSVGENGPDLASTYGPLPDAFKGSKALVMPSYLPHKSSGVTLPSRLDTLGNRDFKFLAALTPMDVGNSVVVRLSRTFCILACQNMLICAT